MSVSCPLGCIVTGVLVPLLAGVILPELKLEVELCRLRLNIGEDVPLANDRSLPRDIFLASDPLLTTAAPLLPGVAQAP